MSPTQKIAENAHVATYGGGAASVAFWGLHVNEICAIISTVVAVMGLILQVYLACKKYSKNRA